MGIFSQRLELIANADFAFFQNGESAPGMSQRDIKLCKTVEQSLQAWREPRDPPVPGLKP